MVHVQYHRDGSSLFIIFIILLVCLLEQFEIEEKVEKTLVLQLQKQVKVQVKNVCTIMCVCGRLKFEVRCVEHS